MAGNYRLIIAEKPSVGRDIARVVGARQRRNGFLEGPGVRVSWCVGHLAELCQPHEYSAKWKSWSPTLLPILPAQFQIKPSKAGGKQLRVLRKLLRDGGVSRVVNACDAGREGELIFRYVYELAGAKAPVSRLWISSLTDEAIRAGLSALRPACEFDALADAARCRSEADWLVGMNATRAMTALARVGGGDALMSVGRVQTPTLALIVNRERSIERFVSEPFWQVDATFIGQAGTYQGRWRAPKASDEAGTKRDQRETVSRIDSRAAADAIAAAVAGQPARVALARRREARERPPQLFDLTTLQKSANKRVGMTAQQTLTAAQALYEEHKALTYPRTDSCCLTADMVPGLEAITQSLAHGYPELARAAVGRLRNADAPGRRMVDNAEVGDHHAIIPTGIIIDPSRLNQHEARVFDLVARRYLSGLLPDAVFAKTHIETTAAGHLFISDGRVCVVQGWQAAEPPAKTKDAPLLPLVAAGDALRVEDTQVREGRTEPAKRFADASLLGAMERADKTVEDAALRRALREKGMGTPATRAAIIENLIRRHYIERSSNALRPTAHGRALVDAMPVPDLLSAELTGAWEEKLAHIARGTVSRAAFMAEIASFVTAAVATITHADAGALATLPASGASGGASKPTKPSRRPETAKPRKRSGPARCPSCKKGRIIRGRRAWGCTRWQESCGFVVAFAVRGVRIPDEEADRLFRRGQTRLMPGFARVGKARLVLDLAQSGNVRVELGARGKKAAK